MQSSSSDPSSYLTNISRHRGEPETPDGTQGLRSVWKMMVISVSGSIAETYVLEERIGENVGKIRDRK